MKKNLLHPMLGWMQILQEKQQTLEKEENYWQKKMIDEWRTMGLFFVAQIFKNGGGGLSIFFLRHDSPPALLDERDNNTTKVGGGR